MFEDYYSTDSEQVEGIYSRGIFRSESFNRRVPPDNQPSMLLSIAENDTIFNLLEDGSNTLSTAVAQLLTPSQDLSQWERVHTGVVCFVRDQVRKSYFIQLFCLQTNTVIFHHELYRQFQYHMPQSCFMTFEGEDSMVGLNFADVLEASNFQRVLQDNLDKKRLRFEARRSMFLKRIQENQLAEESECDSLDSPGPKIQNMVIGSCNNNQNKIEKNNKDIGYAMFIKRMQQVDIE